MRVKVSLYFPFREEIPENPLVLELPEGAEAAQAVAALVARYPSLRPRFYDAQGQIHRHISALVNGVSIQYRRGWATPLAEGDEVVLLPPVGGG
ncbi:MAG: MoaD/ThiS family protein [Candidatus Bipolaricaulota bacterium]|nr:MoaD/ThiS family protein [Candidatus Bipolaricaulota bacterium]MCX7844762.1 MoaD/ThiS family protein [Candidatus Bipolaricaulota bacterium]MDW8151825.1 ubiquitin-like small modifier protein 1 [Candidatus Bipolaricaulota bacterium]